MLYVSSQHHDPCHALDLSKEDSNKAVKEDYIEKMKTTIKGIYAHYSQSPKRFRNLMRLCEAYDVKWEQLHYIFEVRFISSEAEVYAHFLNDLAAIVLHLKQELSSSEISSDVKAKITGYLRIITQFKFVGHLVTQLDQNEHLSEFSKRLQNDTTLWIHYPDIVDSMRTKVRSLKTELGTKAKAVLSQLMVGELHSVVDEAETPAEATGLDASNDYVPPAMVHKRADGKHTIKMKLSNAPASGAVKARLISYQVGPATALLSSFNTRLPVPEVLVKLKGVFDFNSMLTLKSVDPAVESSPLYEHGDSEIDWLVENKFPMLDATHVKNQSLKVKQFVHEHYGHFYDADAAPDNWSAKRKAKHRPNPHLRISGKNSIMEALFTNETLFYSSGGIGEYLHIADYMIAYDVKAADVERVGSHMQLIKTKLRTRLADLTFKALLFLSFNLPLLHDIDIDLLVEAWKAAGHRCQ